MEPLASLVVKEELVGEDIPLVILSSTVYTGFDVGGVVMDDHEVVLRCGCKYQSPSSTLPTAPVCILRWLTLRAWDEEIGFTPAGCGVGVMGLAGHHFPDLYPDACAALI